MFPDQKVKNNFPETTHSHRTDIKIVVGSLNKVYNNTVQQITF